MDEFPKIGPEVHTDSDNKEIKDTRKKGRRGFLESYLRAFYPDRFKAENKDTQEEDGEELKKKSRWERWTERLKRPWQRQFKDTVAIEKVEEGAAQNKPEASKQADTQAEFTELKPNNPSDLGHAATETYTPSSSAVPKTEAKPRETTTKIDHTSESQLIDNETVAAPLEIPAEQLAAQHIQAEQIQTDVSDAESGGVLPTTNVIPLHNESETVIRHNEDVRQREEIRLKREVRRLERTAKDLEHEQQEVRRQQEKFTHNLEKQFKAYEKLHKETLPKLKQSRERLRARLEPAPQPRPTEVRREVQTAPIKVPEAKTIYKQPSDERLMELANISPVVQPEVILHTVEHAAEQNIAIESAYERRHELKDEPVTVPYEAAASGMASISHQMATGAGIDLSELSRATSAVTVQLKEQKSQLPASLPNPKQDLYAQAIKNGFWAAITLLVLLGVLILAR